MKILGKIYRQVRKTQIQWKKYIDSETKIVKKANSGKIQRYSEKKIVEKKEHSEKKIVKRIYILGEKKQKKIKAKTMKKIDKEKIIQRQWEEIYR